jgi:cyclopropane fatty-acyl-phospholipid synthase-like methyltransferase
MEVNKLSIVNSLSGSNDKIFDHLPYLLQDLWELGGVTNCIIQLLDRNLGSIITSLNILELCSGKGAVIISLASKYKCSGKGIDLFEPFINNSIRESAKNNVDHLLNFEIMDIKDAVNTLRNFDIVIYGGDTDVLGNEVDSLSKISQCCSDKGYIVYDTVLKSIVDGDSVFNGTGLNVIDSSVCDKDELVELNKVNNSKIRRRASELITKYPDKKELFENYVRAQEEESTELENDFILVSFLLQCDK